MDTSNGLKRVRLLENAALGWHFFVYKTIYICNKAVVVMNHEIVIPDNIKGWIEENSKGISADYNLALEDTEEAIEVFYSMSGEKFNDAVEFADFLIRGLELYCNTPLSRGYEGNSFYRAFLSLKNDSVVNFRLSRHDATESATDRAWARDGIPDVQYHLTVERLESTSPNPRISDSRLFIGKWVEVCNISLSDFNGDDGKRWDFLRKIINYLKYGAPSISESKINKNMKNVKRINESQLRTIVAESVKRVINEWNDMHQTINKQQAYALLKEAWEQYIQDSSLTSDDVRFVEGIIDDMANGSNKEEIINAASDWLRQYGYFNTSADEEMFINGIKERIKPL